MVSVIIPARNAADLLPTQLSALELQDYAHDWEVIVVDNGSTDGTTEVAVSWSDRLPLRTIQSHDILGVSHARNAGIREARGDLIIFCDADDEVSDQWISSMVEAAHESDAVGGAIEGLQLDDPETMPLRSVERTTGLRVANSFLPTAPGGNLAVWADVFRSLGGFNEGYLSGAEDVEFSWRLQLAGYRLKFSERAIVYVRPRNSAQAMARQFFGYGIGDSQLFRDFKLAGIPRTSVYKAFKAWAWLLVHIPELLRNRSRRGLWLKIAAQKAGLLVGSVRNRVPIR